MATSTDHANMLALLEDGLRGSPADATEIVLLTDDTAVTRFANSEIHQNVAQADTRVAVRVAVGRATARILTNAADVRGLRTAVSEAVALAKLQSDNPRFKELPSPALATQSDEIRPSSFFEATARLSPQARAEAVGAIIDIAARKGLAAFGTYRASSSTLAVASTTGIRSYATFTTAYLKALVEGPDGTGFADALDRDASRINPIAIAEMAVSKCLMNRAQGEIAPGEYEAIFDPNAVADMVRFPAVSGMGARQVLDGQSFMSGKIGQKVTGAEISLWDDPSDPRCMPVAIDFEGMPASKVSILSGGVAQGPVYDVETALEAGTLSTGHAAAPFGDFVGGPQPTHIIMPEGNSSIEDMIGRVRHGVWVTRFHYTHCPDPKRVLATGTTRDGTFLIRDGEVVGALKNLRLEMGVLELLASLQEAGRGKLCQDWWSANGMDDLNYFVPAMRFGGCRFTGVTTF